MQTDLRGEPHEMMAANYRAIGASPGYSKRDDLRCEICGSRMIERQCKILCLNCGFTRDCSDP